MLQTPPNLVMSLPSSFTDWESSQTFGILISQDPNSTLSTIQKKKKAASVFLQEVTSIPISFIVLLIYLSHWQVVAVLIKLTGWQGKKWILTFPTGIQYNLVLCRIQPSKDAKSCLNTLGVCLQWNFRIRMVYKNFLM